MNSSVKAKPKFRSVDDALLAPWAATGTLDAHDARLFAAAMASDPSLADDLMAARAERDAVVAAAGDIGRPSPRPLLALFQAIDAERLGSNVTPLRFDRPRVGAVAEVAFRKFAALR